ncbi:MAG: hypothetical protein PHU56_00410 [Candidatus Pacebacteria bacterium]|nr:hypothetical protein [Candidatus Paceibacterota bacterium]
MRKRYHKIFLSIAIITLLAPFFAWAALDLETVFPAIPGTEQVITGRAKLPDIIRFVVNWTIIIAALATVFSLIYAGVQYLTSIGRPNALAAAKSRIGKCLLGLLIIASSYLVLQTINPQLTIMTIKRQQVGSGIVLFTQAGLYGNGGIDKCYAAPDPSSASQDCVHNANIVDCVNPHGVFGFNTLDSDTLENLIKDGAARLLGYDMPNLFSEFGDIAKENTAGTTVNFSKFPIFAIGFWGSENTQGGSLVTNAKILAYPDTKYSTAVGAPSAVEYSIKGKTGADGTENERNASGGANNGRHSCKAIAASEAGTLDMKIVHIHDDFAANFNSDVTYYDETLLVHNQNSSPPQPKREKKAHPPLSIKVQGKGSGVILYSKTTGGSHSFAASSEDLNLSNVKFDNLAEEIEIRNTEPKKGKVHDYLVILHSGYYYTGDLRIFFARDDLKSIFIPKIYLATIFGGFAYPNMEEIDFNTEYLLGDDAHYCGDPSSAKRPPDCSVGEPVRESLDTNNMGDYFFNLETIDKYSAGALPASIELQGANPYSSKAPINVQDRLGRLKDGDKASSIEIFELVRPDWQGDANSALQVLSKQSVVCREVRLCTGKNFLNDCLVFVPDHVDYLYDKFNSPSRYNSVVLPMPYMVPVNIPKKMNNALIKVQRDDGTVEMERKDIEFSDSIKSIYIDGDCAVVLFENSVKDIRKCGDYCQYTRENIPETPEECDACWDGGPGSHSEVFTESVGDLTQHPISECGGHERFGFGDRKNCASAFAIFPIKKSGE